MAFVSLDMLLERLRREKPEPTAWKMLQGGSFNTNGHERSRHILKNLTQFVSIEDLDPNRQELTNRRLFVEFLREFVNTGEVPKAKVVDLIHKGDEKKVFKELFEYEVGPEKSMRGTGTEWDAVVAALIWDKLATMTVELYRFCHSPESLLGKETDPMKVVNTTPEQLKAKQQFVDYLLDNNHGLLAVSAILELQVTSHRCQMFPLVEVVVTTDEDKSAQKKKSKKSKKKKKLQEDDEKELGDGPCLSLENVHTPFSKPGRHKTVHITTRRRLVGYKQIYNLDTELPPGFATAMLTCDHGKEFVLLIRHVSSRELSSVFVVSKTLIVMDPNPEGTEIFKNKDD
jgi:hypothetical protein